jgi:hypothetical protein
LHLAERFPGHFVLGVDQSADRLSRAPALPSNALLLRADMADIWRLLHEAAYRPARQYMLYPNPWPKIGQLARRWPAHPVFPLVLALGGSIECRSNWRVYVEEFALAVKLITGIDASVDEYVPSMPITPFERKYLASGHALYRCGVHAGGRQRADRRWRSARAQPHLARSQLCHQFTLKGTKSGSAGAAGAIGLGRWVISAHACSGLPPRACCASAARCQPVSFG